MSFLDTLKRSKKVHYLLKVFKYINDEEYVSFFLDRETNPLLLEFKSYGKENMQNRFYVINETGRGYGFFAEVHALLAKLAFADLFKFTPIVSWGKEFLYYEEKEVNAFESYFKQPTSFTLEDIKKSRFVAFSKIAQGAWIEQNLEKGADISPSYERMMGEVYKKYIFLNDNIQKKLDEETKSILQNKKTLGVHFRGTDFKMNYDNHPVAVTIEQEFEAIDQAMKLYDFEQIFLATDEIRAVDKFKEKYGLQIVCYSDVFRGDTNVSVAFSQSDRENHRYQLGYEVLRDMYTLSLCDGFIAGISQVSICARIAKRARDEEYKYLKIIDNGKNHNGKQFIGK